MPYHSIPDAPLWGESIPVEFWNDCLASWECPSIAPVILKRICNQVYLGKEFKGIYSIGKLHSIDLGLIEFGQMLSNAYHLLNLLEAISRRHGIRIGAIVVIGGAMNLHDSPGIVKQACEKSIVFPHVQSNPWKYAIVYIERPSHQFIMTE